MCPNHDWFSTYKEYNAEVIPMGNNAKCKAIRIETINIKMHDSIIRTSDNVGLFFN